MAVTKRFNITVERLKLIVPDLEAIKANLAASHQYRDEVLAGSAIVQIKKAIDELES